MLRSRSVVVGVWHILGGLQTPKSNIYEVGTSLTTLGLISRSYSTTCQLRNNSCRWFLFKLILVLRVRHLIWLQWNFAIGVFVGRIVWILVLAGLLEHHLLQVVGREDHVMGDVVLVNIQKLFFLLQVTS